MQKPNTVIKMFAMLCLCFSAVSGNASPKLASKAITPKPVSFGLTQALATLQECPNARFEGDSMIALGGVLQENQARINAAPVDGRMAMMNQLVADETAKATAWRKTHKLDCATATEQAAGYWNKTIRAMAVAQQADMETLSRKAETPPKTPAPIGGAVTLP